MAADYLETILIENLGPFSGINPIIGLNQSARTFLLKG